TGAVRATVGVTDTTGRVVCTATVQSDGTWSCAALLPIGTSTMTATQTYGNGVLSPASAPITVEVDGVPPTGEPKPTLDPLPAQAGGAPNTTSDTTPTLTGTGVPGHIITVTTAAGDPVCATTVRPDGTWSCDSGYTFPGDPATVAVVHVVQTSPTGTASEVVTGSFTVDASTPAAPVIDAMASPSNEHKPTIAGTGKAGDTVTVVDGAGHTICTATVDASGHWSCVPAAALPDGSVTFTATQTSPNGQTSPVSNAVTVVIGTTDAPTLDQPGTPTADNTPTFTGTATPGATVEVKSGDTVLCTATADASGHWSCTASPAMADGSYHVQAFEVHGDGSTSAGSAIRPLVIDTTAPGKPTLTAGPSPTTNTKPVLSGTAEAGSTVTITDEHGDVICVTTATASGTFACTPTQPLSEGAHTFTATATDAAGNTSQPSDPAGVVVTGPDNTAVTVAILGPSDGSTFETQPDAVHGVATPGATITVTFGDQTFTVTAAADGSWSVPLPTGLNGVYTVSAVATKGGHQSEIARSTFAVNGPQIVRGGCSTGGIPVEWLGLAMLLLLWPRRRQTMALARARKSKTGKIVFGVALVVALPGLAQTTAANAPNVNLRNFTPAPGGDGFAAVTGARPPIDGEGLLEVRLWADDAYQPLVVSTPTGDGRNVLINNRLIGWLGIQAHLNGPLSLAVQLPLTLQQSGSLQNLRSAASTGGVAAGIGDLRLVPRLSILRQETFGIDLAAEAEITIPTAASDSLTGDGRWDAGVTGSVGHRFDVGTGRAALDVVGNVFLDLRPPRQIADVKTGNELGLRAAVGFLPGAPSNWIPNRIFAEADTRTWLRAGFVAGGTPSEWRVGSGWCFARGFSMDGAIGTAIGNGIGSPKARFVFGFGYTPTACRVAEREAAHVPDPVLPAQRPVHLAVVEPPPDRDHDGIPDSLDKCPDVAGLKELDGCPKPPDRDGDGVADADDQCPDVAGPADNHGCPVAPKVTIAALPVMALPEAPPDADGDGVPDAQDNCPHDPGPKENQGCPLRVKQLVVIRGDKVDILEKVQFATGKAIIQPGSFKLLNQVATVLDAHPELTLVEVQGHTDNAGDPKKNQLLSQARADAVVRYLSTHGMDVKRLKAVGYGDQRPVVPNTNRINKEKNRRVEFLVLEMKARVVEVEKPQG
ncbi:MAG: OmpA family protein, partial [Deltaproteobacteria bacterium]|nr:OmpA family protein [Deltaproteobacteria bacterium]